jgi:hypothetical protein
MRGTRRRNSIAWLCMAAVLLAALVPGVSALDSAIAEPGFILLPDLATLERSPAVEPLAAPAASFVSPAPGRAPPVSNA